MIRVFLSATLGALLMAVTSPTGAQDEKKEPEPKEPYTEWVTFKKRAPGEKFGFNNPVRVEAYRKDVKGVQKIMLKRIGILGGLPPIGSEIIDKDDVAWVVTKSSPADVYICDVVRKATPKTTKKS